MQDLLHLAHALTACKGNMAHRQHGKWWLLATPPAAVDSYHLHTFVDDRCSDVRPQQQQRRPPRHQA